MGGGSGEGGGAVVGPVHDVSGALEVSGDDLGHGRVVVDDQDPGGTGGGREAGAAVPGAVPSKVPALAGGCGCCMVPASHRAVPVSSSPVGPAADVSVSLGQRPRFVRSSGPVCPLRVRRVNGVTTSSPLSPASVDVVLPCLDEAAALPWVLARIRRAGAPSWSTTAPPTARRTSPAPSARPSSTNRGAVSAPLHAGLAAATADVVCFCDCDASSTPGTS